MLEKVHGKLGFGMMRLPTKDGNLDFDQINQMVDEFLDAGFTVFDTGKVYMEGKSENAVRECLVKRHPRESFVLANKLSVGCFNSEADIIPCFERQLLDCGVDYFDIYFLHGQCSAYYPKYKNFNAYKVARELKNSGKIKYIGISFHDSAQFLEKILAEQLVDLVMIQLNYLDFFDDTIQSAKCLEVCRKHNIPVAVMEPVKGGNLVNLPVRADGILRDLHGGNNASYALRFAASQDGVSTVFSGMSNLPQLRENIACMKDFVPLNQKEYESLQKVCEVFRTQKTIQCTGCRYCINVCPKHILIPDLFADFNSKIQYSGWSGEYYYKNVHTQNGHGKASDCVKCGKCEIACPQHLKIRDLLRQVAATFKD